MTEYFTILILIIMIIIWQFSLGKVPLITWILWSLWRENELSVVRFLRLGALFFLGLAPYAYLPLSQRAHGIQKGECNFYFMIEYD